MKYLILNIIVIIVLLIYLFSSSYEYYDNYHIKINDNYDELDVKLHDEVFNFKDLYKADAEAIYNFMKIRLTKDELDKKEFKILDAGTGLGKHYQILSKYFRVIGVDKSSNMLDAARVRNPVGEFKRGNLVDTELFHNGDLKGVVCLVETLHMNDENDQKKILENFHKWLKPNGFLFIHIFDPSNLDPGPREFSQYYQEGDVRHALTYFNDFTHDSWWNKNDDNGSYKYNQKYIIDNGKSKLKITKMHIPPMKDTIQNIIDSGFKLVAVKDLEKSHIEAFKLYVFENS